jgi:hypothetical protein
MSRLRAEQVWEMPQEPGLGARYAWLTRDRAERPDISGLRVGHVQGRSLEPGYGRGAGHVGHRGWTCRGRVFGIRLGGQICLA